ncbi:MAG: hypothetical protein ABI472_15785 [Ginsengibacter sp.]
MDTNNFFSPKNKGSNAFSQWDIYSANTTGFTAAPGHYKERSIDLNEERVRKKTATFFMRISSDTRTGTNAAEIFKVA